MPFTATKVYCEVFEVPPQGFQGASREEAGRNFGWRCQQERPHLLGAPPPFQYSLLQTSWKRGASLVTGFCCEQTAA